MQESPHRLDGSFPRFLPRVGAVEMTRYAIQLDVDPRTRPLLNVGSARHEQGFDVSPRDPRLDRVSEDRIQGLAVLPPHT